MNQGRSRFQPLALGLVLAGALFRLIPHPSNFAPIGGMALFGGGKLRGWHGYAVPLLAMLLTDPILSRMAGHEAFSWATVVIYLSLALNVALGRLFLRNQAGILRVGAVALLGSFQFFLVTNFFTWLSEGLYPISVTGLAACYIAAIPFFGYTVLGDLFYSTVLFGVYSAATRSERVSRNSTVNA